MNWGLATLRGLQRKSPRRFMSSPQGKHKSGVENIRIKPIPHFSDLFYFSPLPAPILPQDLWQKLGLEYPTEHLGVLQSMCHSHQRRWEQG